MATNTGAPYNLNKFEGGDLVVPALTQQLSDNMDKLNNADAVIKVWKPNTRYYSGQVVYAPMSGNTYKQVLVANVDHVSSGADTATEWRRNDFSKWTKISLNPVVYGQDGNIGHGDGEIFVDTTEGSMLKRAEGVWPDATVATSRRMSSSLWGLRNWTPNTKYRVGDLVLVNMGNNDTGRLNNAIFRAAVDHTSSTTFPASGNSQWVLTNTHSAYFRSGNFAAGYGLVMYYAIRGYGMQIMASMGYNGNIPAQGWIGLMETLPSNITADDTFFFYGHLGADRGVLYQFNKSRKMNLLTATPIHAGDWVYGSTYTSVAIDSIVWNAGTPEQ